MLDFLFGWRKASKCKKLIRRVQRRIKLLKTKREAVVRQLRDDVCQLMQIGYEDLAFKRILLLCLVLQNFLFLVIFVDEFGNFQVEHLVNDETVLELYELLEHFCEFIVSHLSYIRRNKEIPNDINEAVSSLIFASARCGDLPELRAIRKLFRERYGQRFEATALELLPGNLVNLQVKEKLSIESVPDEVKMNLLDEIAKENSLKPEILTIEFASEFHQQIAGSFKAENPMPESYQDDTISTTVSSSVIEQCPLDVLELESLENSFAAVYTKENHMTSSSESLPQISDEVIVYLDDIEEVKHCNEKDEIVPDQSIFKFKSPVKLQKETKGIEKDSFDPNYDSWSHSDSPGKKEVNLGARRRTKRRSMCRGDFHFEDTQCAIYYEKPNKKTETRHIAPKVSYSKTPIPLTKKEEKPVYMRAKTMPQERSKESHSDNIQRSVSLPVASPTHVHPKLPDYDEIAAKFMALKEEHKQSKHN